MKRQLEEEFEDCIRDEVIQYDRNMEQIKIQFPLFLYIYLYSSCSDSGLVWYDIKYIQDQIIVGNWKDPSFLKGQVYDVVLADYLLGSIDGFAPYFQVTTSHSYISTSPSPYISIAIFPPIQE